MGDDPYFVTDITTALDQLGRTPPDSPVAENARALHDVLRVEQLDGTDSHVRASFRG